MIAVGWGVGGAQQTPCDIRKTLCSMCRLRLGSTQPLPTQVARGVDDGVARLGRSQCFLNDCDTLCRPTSSLYRVELLYCASSGVLVFISRRGYKMKECIWIVLRPHHVNGRILGSCHPSAPLTFRISHTASAVPCIRNTTRASVIPPYNLFNPVCFTSE